MVTTIHLVRDTFEDFVAAASPEDKVRLAAMSANRQLKASPKVVEKANPAPLQRDRVGQADRIMADHP